MTPVDIGALSVVAIVAMVYFGVYIPVALGMVSFVSIWLISGKSILAFNFLKVAVSDGVTEYPFATIPLFTVMGLLVSRAGLGTDIYAVMNRAFRAVTGGIGMAIIIAADDAIAARDLLSANGEDVFQIGEIIPQENGEQVLLPGLDGAWRA